MEQISQANKQEEAEEDQEILLPKLIDKSKAEANLMNIREKIAARRIKP